MARQNVSIFMKDIALNLGMLPREAERCVAVTELDVKLIKKLKDAGLAGAPIRRRVVSQEIPPFWGTEYYGPLASVRLLWSNMVHVPLKTIRAKNPQVVPLAPELFRQEMKLLDLDAYPGLDRTDPCYPDQGNAPRFCQMEGAGVVLACGDENQVAQEDKVHYILRPLSEGMHPQLRDLIANKDSSVFFIPLKSAPTADLWPRVGCHGWKGELSFRLDLFLNLYFSPTLSRMQGQFVSPYVSNSETADEFVNFFTCTGKVEHVQAGDREVGFSNLRGIRPSAYILGQYRPDGHHKIVVMRAPTATRIASAAVTYRAHPAFVMMTGGMIQLPKELIPADLIADDEAVKEEPTVEPTVETAKEEPTTEEEPEKKEKNPRKRGSRKSKQEKPETTPATASQADGSDAPSTKARGSGGGTTMGELLKAKGMEMSLNGNTPPPAGPTT